MKGLSRIIILLLLAGMWLAAPSAKAAASAPREPHQVVGNSDTKRYHLPGMPYYHKVHDYHRVYFASEEEAVAQGYYKAGTGKDLIWASQKRTFTPFIPSEAILPVPAEKQAETEPDAPAVPENVEEESPIPYTLNIPDIQSELTQQTASPTPGGLHENNYLLTAAISLFFLLFIAPFVPAALEIALKRDAAPLFISMSYNKDPRYFSKSFRQMIRRAISGLSENNQIIEAKLSKKEDLQIIQSTHLPQDMLIDTVLCVRGDLSSDGRIDFKREVYVSGDTDSGRADTFHVLACEGNIRLGDNNTFERWVDAEGNLDIGSGGRLGISATCGGRLYVGSGSFFRRLYGMPIVSGFRRGSEDIHPTPTWTDRPAEKISSKFIRRNDRYVSQESLIPGHIVFLEDVRIGHHTVLNGNLRCYGHVELEESVTVYGNIFADGDVIVGKGTLVYGHVFAQGAVRLDDHSIISRPGVTKSVIGKKAVHLAASVVVFGFISTEGTGTVA